MKIVEPEQITTLLLNNAWNPVGLLCARDAFVCFYNNKLSGLDKDYNLFKTSAAWYEGQPNLFDDQPVMRSVSQDWTIPTVLQTDRKFVYHPRKRKKMTLKQMCEIVDFTCQICHKKHPYKDLTREHIIPKCLKGANNITNLTITCRKCNHKKGATTPYFDKLGQELNPIKIPKTFGGVIGAGDNDREEWKMFAKKIANS